MLVNEMKCPFCKQKIAVDHGTRAEGQIIDYTTRCPSCKIRIEASGCGEDEAKEHLRLAWSRRRAWKRQQQLLTELKKEDTPLHAYKVLHDFGRKGLWSEHKPYKWEPGTNIAIKGPGFHFYPTQAAAEDECQWRNRLRCWCPPCDWRRYKCPSFKASPCNQLKVYKCHIQPQDLIIQDTYRVNSLILAKKALLLPN
jgi:hypothetical protein